MFAHGEERGRILAGIRDGCRWGAALGVPVVMSPVDFTDGPLDRAAASLVEVGDVVAGHGLRLALELQSQAPRFNTVERTREVVATAGHPACGLLIDTYHVERSGGWPAVAALAPHEILYVQYSDVPAAPRPGHVVDRLPPGRGTVRWGEVFALLARKGYRGWLSYEAPHEAAWARDAVEVAREAAEATRAFLPA
jgi:4-hydroxyphenylpyruvate dioxygenase